MASNMGQVMKEGAIKLMELIELHRRTTILLMGHRDKAVTSQTEVPGMDRVVMGGMEMIMIRKNIKILEVVRKVIVTKRVTQKTLMSLR